MSKEADFLIYCMGRYRYLKKLSGADVAKIFEKYDIYGYITKYFEALHTMGDNYIVQDIDENGWCKIYQRNQFSVGETIEVMLPDGSNKNLPVLAMEDGDRNSVESAPHPKQEIWINFGEALERGFLLRRKEQEQWPSCHAYTIRNTGFGALYAVI